MNKASNYIKVIGSLFISYLIVILLTSVFFVGNSPLLRPRPDQYIASLFRTQYSNLLSIFHIETDIEKQEELSESDLSDFISSAGPQNMQSVGPGTYAASIKGRDVRILKIDELPTTTKTYQTSKGEMTIDVHKGCKPPTLAEVEEMIK